MRQHENWQKRKCNVYCYKLQGYIYITNCNYLSQYVFFWIRLSSVISKVFVADFEHMFFCRKRYSTKTIAVLILKYLAQQTNTYSKSAAETLKANCKDCASLWTTCSMSKTFFKCFLVYYEHAFVYCDVFVVKISFSMYLLSVLNRFHTLTYFYLLSVLYWIQKKPPEVLFKKCVL